MKIEIWGNVTWHLFHTLAYRLKDEYKNEIPNLYNIILEICHNLPCPECKQHAISYFKKINKSYVISSKENLINFLWKFHNDVNIRLRKSIFSKEQHNELYSKVSVYKIVMNFINIMNENTRNFRMMPANASRINCITKFRTYIMENKHKYI